MKILLLFFTVPFALVFAQEQKLKAVPLSSLKIDADEVLGFDALGTFYFIKDNAVYKHWNDNAVEYKNPTLGKITKVDIQNPLKIVLFYGDFNSIVTLDNQLNETQRINFSQNQTPIVVTATGIASQNQLWIYNDLNRQIGLYDYLKNDYRTISTPISENFKEYHSDFNAFYWIDKNNNWYSCDIFGRITLRGEIPDYDSLEIIDENRFIFCKNNQLIFEDLKKNKKIEIEVSEKTFKKFCYKDQFLSIFTAEGITNYKITLP